MQEPTFEQAVPLWSRLSSEDLAETERDDDLLEACESAILRRDIEGREDALIVVRVLIDNMRSGPRSDGLDIKAMEALSAWLARGMTPFALPSWAFHNGAR